MKTGLFFGSFNPIHIGHLSIAQYILNETGIKKIKFVVSPHNPLKTKNELMDAYLRLDLVRLSTADHPLLEASDIEFDLPLPSYTVQTLEALKKLELKESYTLIMGSDTLESLPQWKEVETILKYPILVYKRQKTIKNPYPDCTNIQVLETPLLHISATQIRQMLKDKKEIKYLVRDEIINLLKFN